MSSNLVTSPWLTARQGDAYVHKSGGTVSRLCKANVIPSVRFGRTRYVHTDDLDAWMRSQPSGADATFAALR